MPEYRVFPLNLSNKVVGPPRPIEASDDDQAIAQARSLFDKHVGVEVWERARRVVCLWRNNVQA